VNENLCRPQNVSHVFLFNINNSPALYNYTFLYSLEIMHEKNVIFYNYHSYRNLKKKCEKKQKETYVLSSSVVRLFENIGVLVITRFFADFRPVCSQRGRGVRRGHDSLASVALTRRFDGRRVLVHHVQLGIVEFL
jgi:hypothetical protein